MLYFEYSVDVMSTTHDHALNLKIIVTVNIGTGIRTINSSQTI